MLTTLWSARVCDFFIVDLWQYCVCCIRSAEIRCTLFMLLYLCCMCQYGLHAVLWSHIGILMPLLATEPRCTVVPLFPSQCPCGTNLPTMHSIVWNWRVSRAGPILFFYWLNLLYPFLSSIFLISLLSVYGLYCVAGVFGLIP